MAENNETPETLPGSYDALDNALYRYDRYVTATSLLDQASFLCELNNAMDDLRTYHPEFDAGTGTMKWDRESY